MGVRVWLIGALLAVAGLPAQAEEVIRAHGIATLGDLKYGPDFAHLDYVNPDAPKGGEISEWAPGGFDSYNPFTIKGRAAALSTIMLESLMTGTADEVGSAYCLLCASIEYPASRDWVIFHLRPEARFSDGSPVTADDVLFSYEIIRDKGLSAARTIYSQLIAGASVIDPLTIRFDFKPGHPRRDLIQTVGSFSIFSRADFDRTHRDFEASSTKPFLGSGPYVFDAADIGRWVRYRRNPDYWGADLPINRGRNNFDRIRVEYFADSDSAFEAFKAGAYTFRNENSSINWATGYDFPAQRNGHVIKAELPDGNKGQAQGFFFNLRRPQFQDIRVRQALGLMFNFEWSNETLFYGMYQRVQSFWDNSDLKASGPTPPDEAALIAPVAADLPDGILTDPAVMPPTSGARQLDRANLRQAAALLDAAGWVVGPGGMRAKDGQPLRVEILNDSQTFDRVITPYVENLRALGVDAKLTRVDNAEYINRERRFDWDMVVSNAHLVSLLPGDELIAQFGSATAQGEHNTAGLANPAIDALIGDAVAATTPDQVKTATRALDRALRALHFWVPQWFKAKYTVAYYDQYAHPAALPPYALGELDFWWYDADKAQKLKAAGALR